MRTLLYPTLIIALISCSSPKTEEEPATPEKEELILEEVPEEDTPLPNEETVISDPYDQFDQAFGMDGSPIEEATVKAIFGDAYLPQPHPVNKVHSINRNQYFYVFESSFIYYIAYINQETNELYELKEISEEGIKGVEYHHRYGTNMVLVEMRSTYDDKPHYTLYIANTDGTIATISIEELALLEHDEMGIFETIFEIKDDRWMTTFSSTDIIGGLKIFDLKENKLAGDFLVPTRDYFFTNDSLYFSTIGEHIKDSSSFSLYERTEHVFSNGTLTEIGVTSPFLMH